MHADILESVKEIVPTAGENNLLMELEAKYAALHRQLEASFADREKKLIDKMNARYAAARRQLFMVILAALFSIAVIWNFKAGTKEAIPFVPSTVDVPVTLVIEATALVPATAPQVSLGSPIAVKAGNGGNFAGGQSAVKH
jgi:hypothetical protein